MDINNLKIASIIVGNTLTVMIQDLIESELDKNEAQVDTELVDTLIELNEMLSVSIETLDRKVL
ncbi:MAG: hypothetical protein E7544_01910 [Ruminococcaceae bacterium]|nr:hypothetical protein [Oscillospiraceae bacterium]